MLNPVSIIGAGGHAKVIIEIIESMGLPVGKLYDQNPDRSELIGYNVVTDISGIPGDCVIGIGDNATRRKLSLAFSAERRWHSALLHSAAWISPRAQVGKGTVVMAGAVINTGTVIGDHVIINTKASVDHDCMIGDYAHISPGAALAGNVIVGEGAQVGIGSSIKQGIKIGKWAIVGAGAVVVKDVPDFAVVAGVPATVIKYTTPL
jgi:sugar O-acyltransferase (sialic acid O-acetyltransferase NeuD family)